VAAAFIGLIGAVIIWVATPYSDYVVLGTSSISGSYLPVAALFLMLLLVLGFNPLFRCLRSRWVLTRSQLAIIFGMLLVASVVPGQGLLRMLPYGLAAIPREVSQDPELAEAYQAMDLPDALFPAKLEYGDGKIPSVVDDFVLDLLPGDTVPWGAWINPLLAWGVFLLFGWMMMIGLAQIVLKQWRDNERLPFPLLAVQESLIEEPDKGHLFASMFRRPAFWVAAGIVFFLHFLVGLAQYNPGRVPSIPLVWDLGPVFSAGIFRLAPWYYKYIRVYFIFVGVAFFMPGRIGFSIWFTQLAYGAYSMIRKEYYPPYHANTVLEHRMGAMFALALIVLWLGRLHWARVFGAMFRPPASDDDRRNRKSAWMFLIGCTGLLLWLRWAGVPWAWGLFLVGFAFVVSLIITRIVAETGMPFIRLHFFYDISFIKLFPLAWLSLPVLFFARVMAVLFATTSRISGATMATHALALDPETSPRRQWRFGVGLVVLLMLGLVLCGAVHLWANYHHAESINGVWRPLNPEGMGMMLQSHPDLIKFHQRGEVTILPYNQAWHLGFGAIFASVLEWACLNSPRWPLHPIGLLMVETYYASLAWFSIFFGWLAKVLILRYGGSKLYRPAKLFFLGLIMGEVFAAVFWSIQPAIRVLMNLTYEVVGVQPH